MRIDSERGYEPTNVKWGTNVERRAAQRETAVRPTGAETGEPAGRGLTATGPPPVTLGTR